MKQSIKYICISGFVILFLSACGAGNASSNAEGSSSNSTSSNKEGSTISLEGIDCVDAPSTTDIDGYETLQSDDTIIKDDVNAIIEIYHDANGLKKVCLVNGLAHIMR